MQSQERDRGRSLKDLAKLAGSPDPKATAKPEPKVGMATSDSSGFIDLAALQATDPAWLENALENAREKAKARHKAPSIAPPIDFEVDDVPKVAAPRNGNLRIAVFSVAGVLVAVGAIGLVLRHPASEAAARVGAVPVTSAQAAAAVPVPGPGVVPGTTAPAAPAAPAAAGAPAETPLPADIPPPPTVAEFAADPPAAGGKHHGRGHGTPAAGSSHALASGNGSSAKASAAAPAPAPGTPPPAKLAAALAGIPAAASVPSTPPPPPVGGALGAAMKSAAEPVGATAPPPAAAREAREPAPAADRSSSSVPDRPSQAVLTSALKTGFPAARACVENDDGPSRVTVTFGSSGAVTSVSVTGPATPKEQSCIKAAFAKTHVPAFAQASYPANFTVRPE